MAKPTLAWHFVGATLRDGRPVPPDGEALVHEGAAVMCESGLHASRKLLDALQYCPANATMLCRVACEDVAEEQGDKLVCRRRTILWRVEAEPVLRAFARRCALDAIHLWDAPDVVRRYLRTGDESLRAAAWAAARDAAWAAAGDAAWAAAWAAARAAAWAAARDAAGAAAWAAAGDAAGAAAWAAAGAKQNRKFEALAHAAHRNAERAK